MELGRKLRILREERHLTLQAVAEGTGYSVSHWSEVERGISKPSLTALESLGRYYGVGWDVLFADTPYAKATRVGHGFTEFLGEVERATGAGIEERVVELLLAVESAASYTMTNKEGWWGLYHLVRAVLGYSSGEHELLPREGLDTALGLTGEMLARLVLTEQGVAEQVRELKPGAQPEEVAGASTAVVELVLILRCWQRLLAGSVVRTEPSGE